MPRYAAIDIGSNSIRMLAAEVVGGSPIKTLASSRQVTRLGESVFRTGRISQSAMDLCSSVLVQMSDEYKSVGVIGVRALGTRALRLKEVFLKSDPPDPRELHRLEEYMQERLVDAVRRFGSDPYDRAIATSATAAALICAVNSVPRAKRETADRLRASIGQVRKF